MLISYGTPIQGIIYDGHGNYYYMGGFCQTPNPPTTFPAVVDPTGASPSYVSAFVASTILVGDATYQFDNMPVYGTLAQAAAAIGAMVAANSAGYYYVATVALTSSPRTFANPTRSLNTAFQISQGQDAQVCYPVDIAVTSLLLATTQGTVTLQYADNSAFTTNVVTVCSGTNSTGGVANVTNTATVTLTGIIPAGKYVKVVTANTAGSPTFSIRAGQEVLL
jgi:hypothetical protein